MTAWKHLRHRVAKVVEMQIFFMFRSINSVRQRNNKEWFTDCSTLCKLVDKIHALQIRTYANMYNIYIYAYTYVYSYIPITATGHHFDCTTCAFYAQNRLASGCIFRYVCMHKIHTCIMCVYVYILIIMCWYSCYIGYHTLFRLHVTFIIHDIFLGYECRYVTSKEWHPKTIYKIREGQVTLNTTYVVLNYYQTIYCEYSHAYTMATS